MATKKSSTSKTARVMNLLSKSREDAAPAEESAVSAAPAEETAAAQPSPAPVVEAAPHAHTPPTPPIISAMQADSAISSQVMSALEDALGGELADAAPAAAVAETSVETEADAVVDGEAEMECEAEEEIPVEEIPVEDVPVTVTPAPAESTVAPAAAVEPAPSATADDDDFDPEHEPAPPTQFRVDRHSTYVNVMETLVEEKAAKYIDLFGLCKCHRCVADVKAYALNHLAPKYVVMLTGEVIPRISVYEGQFSADVTANILNACKIVMANPRHGR